MHSYVFYESQNKYRLFPYIARFYPTLADFQNSIALWTVSRLRPPLHDINWLVFINEECVYCAVRNNHEIQFWLNSFLKASPWLRRLAAGLASRQPWFGPRPVKVRFVLDQVALEQNSLWVFRFDSVSYHSTNTPYSSSSICCSCQKNEREKPGNDQKELLFRQSGGSG